MVSLSPSRTLKALMTCALLAFGALSHAQQVFRVTTIPEEAATGTASVAVNVGNVARGAGETGETSERQWRDVLGILVVRAGALDEAYLDRWGATLALTELLARARTEAAR